MSIASFARKTLQSIAMRYGYRVEQIYDVGKYRLDVLDLLVALNIPTDPDFFFIQIGANDGEANDPINRMIRQYNWRGILLEPQPNVFSQLVKNYSGANRLIFENAALATTDGQMSFWTVPSHTGFGSFNKQVLYRSGVKDTQIAEIKVSAISIKTLLAKHNVTHVSLLQVDTEGYDFEVIKMVIGTGLRPAIINYEHLHLSAADRKACVELLGGCGYKLLQAGPERIDTIAFRPPSHLDPADE